MQPRHHTRTFRPLTPSPRVVLPRPSSRDCLALSRDVRHFFFGGRSGMAGGLYEEWRLRTED